MITKKLTAYGLSVAVAFAAAVVLLIASAPTSANADAGTTSDKAVTSTDIAPTNSVALSGTHVSGLEACIDGTFATSTVTGGTVAAPVDAACTTRATTATAAAATTDLTLVVGSTTGFPDSGTVLVDIDADGDVSDSVNVEVIDYTGKTTTSLTGLTRARAGTTALAIIVGSNVYPATYSQITVLPITAADTTTNVTNGAGLVAGGTTPPELMIDPSGGGGGQETVTVTAKSGNTLTISAAANGHAIGEYVVQISAANLDTATVAFTPTSGGTTGSFKYSLTANGQTSTAGTVSLTIISGKPIAADSETTVSATLPTPVPVLVTLTGTDLAENNAAANQAFTLTALPTKGTLGAISTPICTAVTTIVIGETVSTCTSQVVYTPLLGATGNDSFTYTYTNGVTPDTSAAATVTIVLPGGTSGTPGAGFTDVLVTGVNLTTYGGGTVAQLGTDGAAAGATSVSVTVGGAFIVYVVGAPDFVNVAFADNFTGGVPAGTVVLVLIQS